MSDGNFWEGKGWHVLCFDRLCEIKLINGDSDATYLLLFIKESQSRGHKSVEEVVSYLEESEARLALSTNGSSISQVTDNGADEERYFLRMKNGLENFLVGLDYRTLLEQKDLQTLSLAKGHLPEFYKQAIRDDVAKVLLF